MTPAERLHKDLLAVIEHFMFPDPPADSVEGKMLVAIATAVERYEQVVFPLGTETRADEAPNERGNG